MIYGHPIKDVKKTWTENSCREAFDSKGNIYYVVNLGVSESYQKRGIGSKLLEEARRFAFKNGFSKVVLGSRNLDSNIKFYTKNGFSKVEIVEGYLSDDIESNGKGIIMEYPLNN